MRPDRGTCVICTPAGPGQGAQEQVKQRTHQALADAEEGVCGIAWRGSSRGQERRAQASGRWQEHRSQQPQEQSILGSPVFTHRFRYSQWAASTLVLRICPPAAPG